MSSREKILDKIRKVGLTGGTALPELRVDDQQDLQKRVEIFCEAVEEAGGQVVVHNRHVDMQTLIPKNNVVIKGDQSRLTDNEIKKMAGSDQPVAALFHSSLAVAENGAVWLSDHEIAHRALPFISEHVIVYIEEEDIVRDMHQAYEKLERDFGYGLFVAGPSKTADIEQNLVIGAHGPVGFTVVITDQKVPS